MGYKYARNMQRLIDETNLRINSASSWFLLHRSAYCPGNISVTNEWLTSASKCLRNNNINSQLDATIITVLIISISSTCFGRYFRPSSAALGCVYSLWYKAPTMLPAGGPVDQFHLILVTSRQHRQCFIPRCKHSLALLRMDENIARNMLSWLKLLIKLLLLYLVGCLYYCINDARSLKHQMS